ncbi:MAG: efflux RND transporter periplasmic adaptor subunit [Chloroflexi bacterium]|nr:efflux RND transporter periplasmic adaptor subunit [Chloroflexota bacterium]
MAHGPSPAKALKVVVAAAVIAVGVFSWTYYGGLTSPDANDVMASGTIEAEEIAVSAEVGGRIDRMSADEGDRVQDGDVLAALDTALTESQLRQARAAVDVAKASLAVIERGPRDEDIRQAAAALAQATAQSDSARKAWENAKAMLEDPQDLNARIDAAGPQLESAKAKLDALLAGPTKEQIAEAEAALRAARNQLYAVQASADAQMASGKVAFTREMKEAQSAAAYEGVKVAEARVAQLKVPPSEESVRQARAVVEQAEANLNDLSAMKNKPLALIAQADSARGQYQAAESAVGVAQARLDAIKAGATPEQVAVARAQVRQAEAAVGTVEAQIQKMTLRSPISGMVTKRLARVGETASPGMRVLTLADLEVVKLVVYVPETRIGAIGLGQKANITVDSFPGQVFTGEVVFISPKAEYTPRNVQSQKERTNTVFAVKIRIPNQDMRLKPGMPADARFEI